jgi:hypothetical protein
MILESLKVETDEFKRRTGWSIKPEGACKGDICVPLSVDEGGRLDALTVAEQLQMPLIHDEESGLWCLGPEAMGRALTTAEVPELVLPDGRGEEFHLSSLRGIKVLLVAWASW